LLICPRRRRWVYERSAGVSPEWKFYKSPDSFALAAVWKPEDANAWIGQVGSLFAAGEYMSSAFYLEQALILKPELVKQKIPQTILMQKRDTI